MCVCRVEAKVPEEQTMAMAEVRRETITKAPPPPPIVSLAAAAEEDALLLPLQS
jgi:hypothetical protein